VAVSSKAGIVAVVNAGSNTISLFSVNPNSPSDLSLLGAPIGSGGEFPVSLVFSANGASLCALNGGQVNSVRSVMPFFMVQICTHIFSYSCFAVNRKTGLSPLANTRRSLNLNQTTPASGPPNSVAQIIFSEDGKYLISSVKGDPTTTPPTPGFLAVFDVAQDGSLSSDYKKISAPQGGVLPFSMNVIPGKNAIFASDPAIGFEVYDFSRGPQASTKNAAFPVPNQGAICWSGYSKKTGNYYLVDAGKSIVTEVHIDNNLNGTIVRQYPQGTGAATLDVDIASAGNNE
jgi:hypothetical protein